MSRKAVTTDGDTIRRLRQLKGWSQQELATKVGCDLKTISNAETGKGVQLKTLKWIAEALAVDVSEIIAHTQKRDKISLVINLDLKDFDDKQRTALLELLRKLLPDGGEMDITDVEPTNSTKVTIEMDRDDIPALFLELMQRVGTKDFPIIAYESDAYKPPATQKMKVMGKKDIGDPNLGFAIREGRELKIEGDMIELKEKEQPKEKASDNDS